jgi:uncharacterized protein (TIGR03437 family)
MVLAAVLAGLFCAQTASAQNITVVSGNGQLICQICFNFLPMVVRVTDSNGVPQANVTVNWAIVSGGFNGGLLLGGTTTTANDGTASNSYGYITQPPQGGPFFQYTQTTVTASTANASVPFSLSQALYDPTNPSLQAVAITYGALIQNLLQGQFLTGQAGTTGSTPIQLQVAPTRGGSVANVSVQLVSLQDPSVGPVVSCAGAAGYAPNTVGTVTDPSIPVYGLATCNPVFGGVPGTGQFFVLVGYGGATLTDPTIAPFAQQGFGGVIGPLNLRVTAAIPGLIKVTQGDGQSAAPGQTLQYPLQVEVDTASGAPVAGQSVNWTASPASYVNFGGSTSTQTDVNGRTSVNVTFSGTASGAVQITATCPGCPAAAKSVTFSATAVVPVNLNGLQIVSGNNQTAAENATFGLPLVVQVNTSSGQGLANVNVQFSVTGPASISSSSVPTDSNGRAQVSVAAGSAPGAVTVTATVSSFTQSFSLTVAPPVPPGPTLTASNFYNGADFQAGNISPCSIATIIAPGLAPGIQGVVTPGSLFGPLPYLLASDSVSFNGTQAPIFNVANVSGQQPQITVQVPCEVVPSSSVAVTVTVSGTSATVNVPVLAASPGIFQTIMSDGVLRAVAVRPDGSFVSLSNPARRSEIVRAYATGLGVTAPSVGTNATAIPGTDAIVQGALIMGVTNTSGQGEGVRVATARVAPDLIGVFEIPFLVPSDAATGNNVSFSIGVIPAGATTPIYSATAKLPIQ